MWSLGLFTMCVTLLSRVLHEKFLFLFQNGYYGNVSNIISGHGKRYFSGILDVKYKSLSDQDEKEEGMLILPEAPLWGTHSVSEGELVLDISD